MLGARESPFFIGIQRVSPKAATHQAARQSHETPTADAVGIGGIYAQPLAHASGWSLALSSQSPVLNP